MADSLALTVAHGATSRTERDTQVVNLESSTSIKVYTLYTYSSKQAHTHTQAM